MFFFFFENDQQNAELSVYGQDTFDGIRHFTDDGVEFWYARELQKVLEYTEWRNFCAVIDKAKIACEQSENAVDDHFVDVNKMVPICYKSLKNKTRCKNQRARPQDRESRLARERRKNNGKAARILLRRKNRVLP